MQRSFVRLTIQCGWLVAGLAGGAHAQVRRLADMNVEQIRALDRSKTAIIFPGGIVEEHGPYLPTFTDGYADDYYAIQLAAAIAARPGWTAVIYPEIPLGFGGANNIGGKYDFPGSYTIRVETLRQIYMDLGDAFGAQGFRWLFIVHDHGDPAHNQALDDASDYFHDVYGGTMAHLFGLTETQRCYDIQEQLMDRQASEEDGFTVHAGAEEHSEMLFLHPDLVDPAYARAAAVTGRNFVDLYHLAERPDWPGYFGAPARAGRGLGERVMAACAHTVNDIALRLLNGADYRALPRFYDQLDPRDAIGDKNERAHDREITLRQERWLASKRQRLKTDRRP